MKVSFVSGVCVLPDAISYSIVRKVEVLRQRFGAPGQIDYRIFVFDSNLDDPRVQKCYNPTDLALDPFFASSDVVIYEFGIFCSLFDTIFVLPRSCCKIVVYHNITPEHLVAREDQKNVMRRSMAQKANLSYADYILADSEYNRRDLVQYGLAPEKIETHNLPLADVFSPAAVAVRPPHPVAELLFVGRFVHSKGVLDLVRGVTKAVESGCRNVRLTLIGDTAFSDPDYLQAIKDAIVQSRFEQHFRFIGGVTSKELFEYYRASDVLVIPSYHEGYCLPVVEALSTGCVVIAYDAGNLSYITNGLGKLVPAGNVDRLAETIAEVARWLGHASPESDRVFRLDRGDVSAEEFARLCREYTSKFTFEKYAAQFSKVLRDVAGVSDNSMVSHRRFTART